MYVMRWAQPGMARKVLADWLRRRAPVRLRPMLDPALWQWLRRWWCECELVRYQRHLARLRPLAFCSRAELRALRERLVLRDETAAGCCRGSAPRGHGNTTRRRGKRSQSGMP
ncbi:MAG: hypothetical protein RMK97_03205 [Sutterellaceae bacterium]|nr:hypothetical protein [Burkholderiaceae bacterium]MDW8429502.1 hypothetical protein [Sutterellaceae bacterium]